jgi:hypothetical protein
MKRFGLVVVALLAVLGGVLGWAVVAGPVAVPLSTTSTITPVLSSADPPLSVEHDRCGDPGRLRSLCDYAQHTTSRCARSAIRPGAAFAGVDPDNTC